MPVHWGSQSCSWRTIGLDFRRGARGRGGLSVLVNYQKAVLPAIYGCFDPKFQSLFPHLGAGMNIKEVGVRNLLNAKEVQ